MRRRVGVARGDGERCSAPRPKGPGVCSAPPPRRGHVCSLRSTVTPLMLPGWLRAGCEGGAGSWGAVQTGGGVLWGEVRGAVLVFAGVPSGEPGSVARAAPLPFPPFSARGRSSRGCGCSLATGGARPGPFRAGGHKWQGAEAPERWDRVETGSGRAQGGKWDTAMGAGKWRAGQGDSPCPTGSSVAVGRGIGSVGSVWTRRGCRASKAGHRLVHSERPPGQ